MTYLAALLTWRNFINLIDILVIWFLIYELMVLVRGTRAVQLFKGIIIIIVVKLISWYIGLTTVSWVMDQIINWGVIAMVVIFQPEIRRGLEHLGRGTMFTRTKTENEEEEALITQLDQAIQYMSKRRIGALIAIEMDTGLEEYIETGIPLDAEVTGALLINTFIPNTPLHDGAVIIKGGRIAVAAAYLPLSDSKLIPKELGTRHRAAVGISEVTDALTIVISEETGGVSITKDNELIRDMTQENYLKFLRAHLYKKESTVQNKLLDRLVNPFRKGGRHEK
ncbi:diadenylate cyclase CdaA [Limosilactobacillus fermentum]|uniref:diadenylate cyclase CdaA n=1 Tax=Limosilactobacillus fermentum TaxID=1613 RepID=UPI000A3C4C51|nr:diadenylate cyclase CdaA [Limosilactobacillus fermentum]MBD9349514.1 TIGR00159 family protein [Limosilactobacillus fermentum]MBE4709547.1 TIGR00159 family protein [Limosilactobacillus fermentum]MCT2870164.1 TIGR00159 family protein [Limosilactobacillus fermentum]MCT2872311.1 TIGR00159 family protein [Limosilactobacillus fermentum]PHI33664.1 TIGR00159 family protein [Limosilactobacillus fermentum]